MSAEEKPDCGMCKYCADDDTCRRNPPQYYIDIIEVNGQTSLSTACGWPPVMDESDWCGEFVPRQSS